MPLPARTDPNAVSFWQANDAPPVPGAPLRGDIDVDVAIIGGGFTGLSVAREIRSDDPSARVAVLEGRFVGYGASGRNGGFNMSLFGLEPEVTILRWGVERAAQAQQYMNRAVAFVKDLVEKHGLKSDYQHPGMLRVAYNGAQLKRLEKGMELHHRLGVADRYALLPKADVQAMVRSEKFQGGVFEAESGILNPYRHVRELKRLAEAAGAEVYEGTPVANIARDAKGIRLATPNGTVTCRKLVIAVNAWSGFIRGLPKMTLRIDLPACIRSKPLLISSSVSVCVIIGSISILPSMYQSTIFGTSVRPRAPPKAVPFQTRPVTSWNGRVDLLAGAGDADDDDLPQPRWQASSACRMTFTLPVQSNV
jgi:glycine/D-amino acid oxidase-like deaminating enzyme